MHHAGIDYDYPFHEHDPKDYKDGVRKETGLRQGRHSNKNLYHANHDDIVASNTGEVVFAESDIKKTHGFGRVVIIRHSLCSSDLSDSEKRKLCDDNGTCEVYSKYAHMSKLDVKEGDYVERGQEIGEIGGSGTVEDQWIHHLHFELTSALGPDDNKLRAPFCSVKGSNGKEVAYGYVDVSPGECGYLDPNKFFGKVSVCEGNEVEPPPYEPPGEEIVDPGHPRNNGDPDMKISTVTLSKGAHSTRYHELEQDPEEKFYAYAKIKNVGTARAEDFKVKFYIDGGKKNFNRDDEDYQDSVRIEEFNSGAEIRYSKELTSPTEPGTYWVYACITSIDEDSDMSNNCSDEDDKDEYGKLIIVEPPPVPSDLTAHSLRLNSGANTILGGRLFGLTVTVQNIGDGDAESNFQIRHEINGPSTGYTWETLAESSFSSVPLYAGSSEEHRTGGQLAAAPTQAGDYRFRSCVDSRGVISESDEGNNCSGELEIEVLPSLNPSLKPVYRFWSHKNHSHFYTISEAEKNYVINNYPDEVWKYEGVAWCAYKTPEEDSLPVYRFWSEKNKCHFYTISETEKNKVIDEYDDYIWKYEHIEWYAFNYAKAGTKPVYRFWSEKNKCHFYTASETEKQKVIDEYDDYVWKYEHEAWWVYPCP